MDLITVQAFFQQGMFNIPNYQRGYAWGRDQVKDFLEDLLEAADDSVQEHYTGTITVIETGNKLIFPKNFKVFDVVDGQQRFITFTIFVHAIHNRFKALKVENDVLNDILKNIIYQEKSVLTLNSDSDNFYQNYIINGTVATLPNSFENKSQANLASAKKQITSFLERHSGLDELQGLYNCLMTKFKVNFYKLSKQSEVGVVFETMNNRGVQLSNIDKVKNYLIFLSARLHDEQLSNYINNVFGSIFKEMMKIGTTPSDEDSILRYSLIIYKGENVTDTHAQIKYHLNKNCKVEEIKHYVDFLNQIVVVYAKIFKGDFTNVTIKSQIEKIMFLGNQANFLPLIIALLDKYKENDLIEVLRVLEVFSFRVYKVCFRQSTAAKSIFHKLSYQIYANIITKEDVIEQLEANQYAKDKEFKSDLEDKKFAGFSSEAIAYFFYEYECYLHEQNNSHFPLINFSKFYEELKSKKLSVEHIEPQNPLNRDPSKYLHKLGNLTITYNNSLLSNNEFNVKKETYKKSELLVEKDIVQHRKWDDDEINDRTKKLAKFALQRWKF